MNKGSFLKGLNSGRELESHTTSYRFSGLHLLPFLESGIAKIVLLLTGVLHTSAIFSRSLRHIWCLLQVSTHRPCPSLLLLPFIFVYQPMNTSCCPGPLAEVDGGYVFYVIYVWDLVQQFILSPLFGSVFSPLLLHTLFHSPSLFEAYLGHICS